MTDSMNSDAKHAAWPSEGHAAGPRQRGRIRSVVMFAVLAIAAISGAIWYAGFRPVDSAKPHNPQAASGKGARIDPALRPTRVLAAPVRQGTLAIYLYALGTVTPLNAVTVRSRVDGQLMRVAFEEGQLVKAGDL